MSIRLWIFTFCVLISTITWASTPFEAVDAHARACPENRAKNVENLANYLLEGATTDLEKARAAYVWISENICYDDEAFNDNRVRNIFPKAVLKNRRAICEGFSNLYQKLGELMGLNIKKVVGYAKGFGFQPTRRLRIPDHAWNIIEIGGEWRVFDVTWGSGYAEIENGKLKTRKGFETFWFNLDPYAAIFSHLPQNQTYAMVNPVPTVKQFKALPNINRNYFKLGFEAKQIYKNVLEVRNMQFPLCYDVETEIVMKKAPALGDLKSGEAYAFEFYIPDGIEMAVITDEKDWTEIHGEKGYFQFTYTPKEERYFKVSVQHEGGGELFHSILRYEIK